MANFMNIELQGEANDLPCNPTRYNTVIKTKWNGFKLADSASWDDWTMGIVFPDNEKAQFFIDNFKPNQMMDYREGMLKAKYVVHILHFKYPKPKSLYADQIQMTSDFESDI